MLAGKIRDDPIWKITDEIRFFNVIFRYFAKR